MTKVFIGSFDAEDDEGNIYTVEQYQEQISVPQVGAPNFIVPGAIDLRLDTGESVSPTRDGNPETFEIVQADKIIRKIR